MIIFDSDWNPRVRPLSPPFRALLASPPPSTPDSTDPLLVFDLDRDPQMDLQAMAR